MSENNDLEISSNDIVVPRTQYNVMTADGNVALNYQSAIAVIRGIEGGLMLGFALMNKSPGPENIALKKGDIYYTFIGSTQHFMKLVNEFGYIIGNVSLNLLSNDSELSHFNSGTGFGWSMFPWTPKF